MESYFKWGRLTWDKMDDWRGFVNRKGVLFCCGYKNNIYRRTGMTIKEVNPSDRLLTQLNPADGWKHEKQKFKLWKINQQN
jgi:hypothetical protein